MSHKIPSLQTVDELLATHIGLEQIKHLLGGGDVSVDNLNSGNRTDRPISRVLLKPVIEELATKVLEV